MLHGLLFLLHGVSSFVIAVWLYVHAYFAARLRMFCWLAAVCSLMFCWLAHFVLFAHFFTRFAHFVARYSGLLILLHVVMVYWLADGIGASCELGLVAN